MHGMLGPLRQFVATARPWQKVAVGAVLVVVGVLLQAVVITVVGALVVAGTLVGRVRGRGRAVPGAPDLDRLAPPQDESAA
jgi:hypothetical protein